MFMPRSADGSGSKAARAGAGGDDAERRAAVAILAKQTAAEAERRAAEAERRLGE
jgi:hypothetical protein